MRGFDLLSTTSKFLPAPQRSPSSANITLPYPTPWYSPAGPFDWWQWQWYTTRKRKPSKKIISTQPTTTTTITTTTTTITITTTTTTTSTTTTRQSATHLTNNTNRSPTATPANPWLQWADDAVRSTEKTSVDDSAREYAEWLESFTTDQLESMLSTTISPLAYTSSEQNEYFRTKSNWKIVTINTPPAKRHHSQQNPTVSERNAIGMSPDGKNK